MTRPRTPFARQVALAGRLVGLGSVVLSVAPPGSAAAAPSAGPGDRSVAGAAEHEARWAETRDLGALERAAEARARAGHLAHALAHWRTLLAQETGVTAARRGELERKIAAAQRQTRATRVRVLGEGGPVAAAQLSLRWVGDDRPAIELEVADTRILELDPGVWSLVARAPGHVEVQRVWTVAAGPGRGPAPAPEELTLVLPTRARPVVLRVMEEAAAPEETGATGVTTVTTVTWTLTPAAGGEPRVLAMAGAETKLSLEPGRWRARVEAPGFVAQELELTVAARDAVGASGMRGAGDEVLAPVVTLRRVPAPPVEAPPRAPARNEPRLGLGLGLGLAGSTSLGIGVGLLIQHREGYRRFTAAPNNAGFVAALSASDAGASLVGAGLGLGGAALTAGLGAADRVLWAEVAVGGGVALIGSAWYARDWQRVQKDLYDGNKDPDMDGVTNGHDVKAQRRETAAASLIGAGGGLMIGASAALLTRTIVRLLQRGRGGKQTGRHTAPWGLAGGPGQLGLGLRGRF